MTRETKVGLLVGMGVILLVGIIVSDHLAIMNQEQESTTSNFADRAQDSIDHTPPDGQDRRDDAHASGSYTAPSRRPVPTREEIEARRRESTPASDEPRDQVAQQRSNYQPAYALDRTAAEVALQTPSQSETADAPAREDQTRTLTIRRAVTAQAEQAASNDQPGTLTHEVKPNESLYAIAQHYYGNGAYWRVLREHNEDKVGAEGQVRVGVELTIPNRAGLANVQSDGRTLERRANAALRDTRTIAVESGDTLSKLAAAHLGSPGRWRDLLEANADQLETAMDLRAGMTLKLPAGASEPSGRSGRDAGETGGSSRYTVKAGDSLAEIAERMLGSGSRWRDVYEANQDKIQDPNVLPVGVELRIPG